MPGVLIVGEHGSSRRYYDDEYGRTPGMYPFILPL